MQDSLNDVFPIAVLLKVKAQYPSPVDAHHVVAARKGMIRSGSNTDAICR